jgi:hypothetical protein
MRHHYLRHSFCLASYLVDKSCFRLVVAASLLDTGRVFDTLYYKNNVSDRLFYTIL